MIRYVDNTKKGVIKNIIIIKEKRRKLTKFSIFIELKENYAIVIQLKNSDTN